MHQIINISALDRCGKDTLRSHIVKQSKGNYLVIVRSFIDQIVYSRIYKRSIDEQWFIDQALKCQSNGQKFFYLTCDTELIAQRIIDTNELDITVNDIEYHKQIFNEVIEIFRQQGLKITIIDTTDQDLDRMFNEVQSNI